MQAEAEDDWERRFQGLPAKPPAPLVRTALKDHAINRQVEEKVQQIRLERQKIRRPVDWERRKLIIVTVIITVLATVFCQCILLFLMIF